MEMMNMTSGGARNRSGPQPDPKSGRSDRRGLTFQALPNEGYQGRPPRFPLAAVSPELAKRERAAWREAWKTPQACVWALEPWRWPIVAEYCRIKASVEMTAGQNAAVVGQLHRYRDQLGLTPAGLRENGWAIAPVEIAPTVEALDEEPEAAPAGRASSRNRMKVVGG